MAEFEIDELTGKRIKEPTDSEILAQVEAVEETRLRTHELIDPSYVGNIESLSHGRCRVSFVTAEWMVADSEDMIHSGFLAMSAEFTALAAINEPNGMMMDMESHYLTPVRLDDEIIFEAKVRHTDGRKREVDVVGVFNDIKVYQARATIVITEYHPLKIKLNEVAGVK